MKISEILPYYLVLFKLGRAVGRKLARLIERLPYYLVLFKPSGIMEAAAYAYSFHTT